LPIVVVLLVAAVGVFAFHKPPGTFRDKRGLALDIRYSRQSGIGLLQVFDTATSRILLINGVVQGQMETDTGQSGNDYIRALHLLTYSHHPSPKTALQLGLGAGLLPGQLAREGITVTAVEIEPRMPELARRFFDLPDSVRVHIADARSFLRHDPSKYDVIYLDTFASESTPWHMLTREAFEEMKARLNPGGRLLINTVAYAGANG